MSVIQSNVLFLSSILVGFRHPVTTLDALLVEG